MVIPPSTAIADDSVATACVTDTPTAACVTRRGRSIREVARCEAATAGEEGQGGPRPVAMIRCTQLLLDERR
jgi:hypothetical protein